MILPREALERISRNEIQNRGNLVKRLTGERPFPLEISLQVPTQKEIVADIGAYRDFIRLWREFRFQELLIRRTVEYRTVNGENVPAKLVIRDWDDLMKVAGDRQRKEIQAFQKRTEKLSVLSGSKPALAGSLGPSGGGFPVSLYSLSSASAVSGTGAGVYPGPGCQRH